jgi:hypothetical protein
MMTAFPIYIPSRGRAKFSFTADVLIADGQDISVVVEPHEFEEYAEKLGAARIVSLGESGQGIAYARSFIKRLSISRGEKYHWQIDDNIRGFYLNLTDIGKVVRESPGEVLSILESTVGRYKNVGVASLRHQNFARLARNEIDVNRQCYSCMLVNNYLDIYWRKGTVEDTDYSLQVLSSGFCTMLFNRLIFGKYGMMKHGGNNDTEYSDDNLSRCRGLQEFWPGEFEIQEKDVWIKKKERRMVMLPSRVWKKFSQLPEEDA